MPTAPDPNSPFLDSQLQAEFGLRTPNTPIAAGKPTVQAADVAFPAPPAVAAGPAGRPPSPPTPAPFGAGEAAAPPAQPPAAAPTLPASPVGASPLVVPSLAATGETRLALSPEGDARYREAVLQLRTSLGPIPSVFRNPNLPQMPAEVGKMNLNPFTGQFHKG